MCVGCYFVGRVIVLYCIVLYCRVLHCCTLSPGIDPPAFNNNNNNNNNKNKNKTTTKATTTTQFPHKTQGLDSTVTGQQQAHHLLLNTITHSLPTVTHKVGATKGGVGERLAHKKNVMKGIQIVCVICIVLTLE